MTVENDYEKAEIRGRQAFQRLIAENPKQARRLGSLLFEKTDARYDCSFTWDGVPCIAEIKERNHGISKYDTYLLERGKWMSLAWHHRKGTQVYYVMLFDEGNGNHTGLMFDLSRRFEDWGLNGEGHFTMSKQPTKTLENLGTREKLICYLVPFEHDIKFKQAIDENKHSTRRNGDVENELPDYGDERLRSYEAPSNRCQTT